MTDSNDIAIAFDGNKLFIDLMLNEDESDFAEAFDLENAVLISLFTNRRSDSDDDIPNAEGWEGDTIREDGSPIIGSKLWILQRSKIMPNTLIRAENYATESLQWLIDDGIAASITVSASYFDKALGVMSLDVEITRPQGEDLRYEFAWNQIKNKLISSNV